MSRKFLTPIDMGQLEILNLRTQNLSSAPGSPVAGQVYYDTTANTLYFRGSSSWINANPASLLGTSNTWTAAQTINAAITGNNTINLTGTGSSGVGGLFGAVGFSNSGLTGAVTASRWVGATASGAPATGTFSTGDFIITTGGDVYICTSGGSPGTWARVGSYLLGANNTWTGTNAFNAAITGNNTINLTGTGSSSVAGTFTGTAIVASGLTGATSASRYVGATSSGAPATGTFSTGDFVIARDGAIWVCTAGGTPGTWVQIGAVGTVYYQTVKNNAGTGQTQRANLRFNSGTYTTATVTDSSPDTVVVYDVSTATPSGVLTFGGSNASGSSTNLARADHVHALPAHDAAAHSSISRSALAAPSGDIGWGGYKITNLGTPSAASDAATKGYVDSVATGLDVKASVRAASAGSNVTVTYSSTGGTSARGQITAAPNTLDGVSLAANDRILLKDQSTGAQNGIWVVSTLGTGSNGVWDRATDFDQDAEVTPGAFTFVTEGTVNADSGWVLATDGTIVIGGASGTALTFAQFSGAGQITAGSGLTKSGNTLNVGQNANNTIVVNADDITVNRTGTSGSHVAVLFTTATHSSATSIAITHNLGQQWVVAQVYEVSTGNLVDCDVTLTSSTVATFGFSNAPTANSLRFNIWG